MKENKNKVFIGGPIPSIVFGSITLLVSLIFIFFTGITIAHFNYKDIQATIIDFKIDEFDKKTPILEYEVNSKVYQKEALSDEEYILGQVITIFYNPKNPEQFDEKTPNSDFIIFVIAIVLFVFGIYDIKKGIKGIKNREALINVRIGNNNDIDDYDNFN